jgi:L-ascorbate metabolism protein UlaG (beta-lactamase superfamily)
MKIQFIAQSGFIIEENDQRICIDLWAKNPVNPITLDEVLKVNHVFITHDHDDHDMPFGIEIAKRDNATLHANEEIVARAMKQGVKNVEHANIGGLYKSGNIEVVQVHAEHTSNTGIPVGFIIKFGGKTLYHMGDTGYYKGFDLLDKLYLIDILFIPIGGRFTMGPVEASFAVQDIKPKYIIPMHYNTFPQIEQNVEEFKALCKVKCPEAEMMILKPER